nr:MAG TPA: hypothetical protein [Caudoviricetes sp.]
MSAVTAISQRYTGCRSGVRKWCGGGQERCLFYILAIAISYLKFLYSLYILFNIYYLIF